MTDTQNKKEKYFYEGKLAIKVAEENGISKVAFNNRLWNGWSVEDACTKPMRAKFRKEKYELKIDFFTAKLYRQIVDRIRAAETDVEKIIIVNVVTSCIMKRWQMEPKYGIKHEDFKRLMNFLNKFTYDMDIPEDEVDNIVKANQSLIDLRIEKEYPSFFGKYEKEKVEKWQKQNQ